MPTETGSWIPQPHVGPALSFYNGLLNYAEHP
jgi:hypothetical protein